MPNNGPGARNLSCAAAHLVVLAAAEGGHHLFFKFVGGHDSLDEGANVLPYDRLVFAQDLLGLGRRKERQVLQL